MGNKSTVGGGGGSQIIFRMIYTWTIDIAKIYTLGLLAANFLKGMEFTDA